MPSQISDVNNYDSSNVILFKKPKPKRKSRKEYDLFHEARKRELGDDYPQEENKHWSREQFRSFLATGYSDRHLEWLIAVPRRTFVSPAYLALSFSARELYRLCLNQTSWEPRKVDKRHNERHFELAPGKPRSFRCPYNLCLAIGFTSKNQIVAAFKELIELRFIRRISKPRLGEANIYKITDGFLQLTQSDIENILKK